MKGVKAFGHLHNDFDQFASKYVPLTLFASSTNSTTTATTPYESMATPVVRLLMRILCLVKDYFDNSSIQGLRYIMEPKRHFTERVFWVAVCVSAMLATHKVFKASWYNYQNNAVSFVVETSYLDWNTTFAAVSICENESPDKIYESGNKLFGKNRNMNMDFYLRDIAFFDGTCYSCKTHCGKTMNCTRDLEYLIQNARATCEKFLKLCSWNGKPFDCCSQFLPLSTETGTCFTIHSLHTKSTDKMKLISNRFTGPGRLDLLVFESAKLYIHSPEDVPYINHPQEEKAVLNWGSVFSLSYQINEIENDPMLDKVAVEQRNCRFPEENTLDVYSKYSYSACVVDCRAKAQAQLCNCTHHFMPKLETLRALRTKDNDKKGLVCNCMSSCSEPEYIVLMKQQEANEDYPPDMSDYGSKVSVVMEALPSQRFKRNVVRTSLDLVVSMGGTAGLFLGASLLSIAELWVFIFMRNTAHQLKNNKESKSTFKKDVIKVNPKPLIYYSQNVKTNYSNKFSSYNVPFMQ